jgi:hypothetical protein
VSASRRVQEFRGADSSLLQTARPFASPVVPDFRNDRALWAIDPAIESDAVRGLKSLRLNTADTWKAAGSGNDTYKCYELYVKRIKEICGPHGLDLGRMDQLLMPLGQTIKRVTDNYAEFRRLWE